MAKLIRSVFVRDPAKHRDVLLRAGEEPSPELAALVKNPACWEDGEVPASPEPGKAEESVADGDSKQATRKVAAKPARGRKAVDAEGDGGQ